MKRLLFWFVVILPVAVIGLILSAFILPLFGKRPSVTSADLIWTIIILSAISAWITGIRMRRKIKRVLGREATGTDLASIKTWMQVDEQIRCKEGPKAGGSQDSVASQVSDAPEFDEASFDNGVETSAFTTPASTGLIFPAYPTPGVEIVPTTYTNGWFIYGCLAGFIGLILLQITAVLNLLNATWLPRIAFIYGAGVLFGAMALRNVRLEIRTDGISYTNTLRRSRFLTFAEISSIVRIRGGRLIVMPRPETEKRPLKIPLELFPLTAQEQVMRVLRPSVRHHEG
jgi:hypothetical protein